MQKDDSHDQGYVAPFSRTLSLSGATLSQLMAAVLSHSVPFRFTAHGHSMYPFIRDSDVVTVAPLGQRVPRVGDVVASLSGKDRLVIHRVVAADDSRPPAVARYLIRGDNCAEADGRVPAEAVLGIVTRVERGGRPRRLGMGPGAAALALLSRMGVLRYAIACSRLPRRAAGIGLKRMQQTPSYRRTLRRMRPALAIALAGRSDEVELARRFGLLADLGPRDDMSVTAFVARVGGEAGRVVGFVELVRRDASDAPFDGAWVCSAMVETPYRGMGVAEALLRRAIAAAREAGAEELRLVVHADNAPALALYRKLGFVCDGSPALAERLESEERLGGPRQVALRVTLAGSETGADKPTANLRPPGVGTPKECGVEATDEVLSLSEPFVGRQRVPDLSLWGTLNERHRPISFELEITARCNNDCRHCYVNLPAGDGGARASELTTAEILDIARQATDMGAVWCLITGGEPLLRDDFEELYLGLKRLGLLVSLFTNACLITPEHVKLLQKYPPRDIEVSVYGATRETYEAVTRCPGSYDAFVRGLDLLLEGGLKVRLKAMVLRSNVHEIEAISRFCRERTKDYYRFDPLLHLRYDGDPIRNAEIRAERLTPEEIVAVERADEERFGALQRGCAAGTLIKPELAHHGCDHLFHCGAGNGSFTVGYDGAFRLCSSLCHPNTVYDLGAGTLREAWEELVPRVRDLRGTDPVFLERCRRCELENLCMWCPANASLETGEMDAWVEYFCDVAHARAEALGRPTGATQPETPTTR